MTEASLPADKATALAGLRAGVPNATVEFDAVAGTPKMVLNRDGFLTDRNGVGRSVSAASLASIPANDPNRVTKAFLQEHRALFGHGPEALDRARVQRDFVTPHNGMRTVVWQQQVDNIPVFEALLISHVTRNDELVNIGSHFLPDPDQAANRGATNRAALEAVPNISAQRAVAIAAQNLGEDPTTSQILSRGATNNAEKEERFTAAFLIGDAEAKLTWLPMDRDTLRLCWDVILMSRSRHEMYRVLVDAETGEVQVRHCLTDYLSNASFRVFTSDSPTPFSPGYSTPQSTQPPVVSRTLVTLSALDTNASPAGWINDTGNETIGNNVDAHTDWNNDNVPDLPRPQGSPFRVFDFPMDLTTQNPTNYSQAAVVQLFYWNNFMHDKLYGLGFNEAAGNFQSNNFGRGGVGNDAVQADAQDGGGFNNANFSTPPDGSPGRMQMYIFNGPTPQRDGDLDAEVVLHEYTHGLSNRRVGGGVGISALQPSGMGEGWSDFYALSMLSEAGDDPDGVYASGAYVTYMLNGMTTNYYFGIRRYPYCTDMSKNPLTFKDIDPGQASSHSGIPRSSIVGTTANEVHNMGEVWCVTLWDARANLVKKYGWATGNQLMLQLVTDGMNLSPANPNFLQARDAILQADLVDTGGANRTLLWMAFAKRGMGSSATSPVSSTTTGVQESYDLPDDLALSPGGVLNISGPVGGPFSPACQTYTVLNSGTNNLPWTAYATQSWLQFSTGSGILAPGASNSVNVCLSATANSLPVGSYSATIIFSNQISGVAQTRAVSLYISPPRVYYFPLDTDPGWPRQGEWAFGKPAGLGGISHGSPDPTSGATGTNVFGINLNGDYSLTIGNAAYLIAGPLNFTGISSVKLQFQRYLNSDYPGFVYATIDVSTNGTDWSPVWSNTSGVFITDTAWSRYVYDLSAYADNQPTVYVRWGHRVASSGAYAFSGWNIDDIEFLGNGAQSLALTVPTSTTEGAGSLPAMVTLSPVATNDTIVLLSSSNTNKITVPASVTVPADTSNYVFNITVLDDNILDGPQTVTITANAGAYTGTSANITVADNETATLQVQLPPSATEGQGTVQGTIQSSAAPTADFTVFLTSSDTTEIQVPPSVILPAGQTSAVFTATVVDDNQIDGPQNATVTAHVPNWTDGSATITVQDNENLNLVVSLPPSVWENAGPVTNAGSVSISGTLPTNLVVNLSSAVPTRLGVSSTTTILAGSTAASFDLLPVDNSIVDGHQPVTITANAPGFIIGTNVILVLDDESPPPPSNPSPANLQSNVDQTTPLSWTSGAAPGKTITNDVYFGTSPTLGPGQLLGSTTNSNWTLPVLSPLTTYYWQIVAHSGGDATGAVWQFTTRGVDHFVWAPVGNPQVVDQPFSTTLTAKDQFENTVTNFTGPARLSASIGTNGAALFGDNFEDGDFDGWDIGTGSYIRAVTNQTAAGGNYSFTLIGGSGAHGDGVSHSLSNITPSQVTFYVRAASTSKSCGYFVLGGDAVTVNVAAFFYMKSDGTMGLYENSGGWHGVPYNANQWYKIGLQLNWQNKTMDYYVNDSVAFTNVPFRVALTNLTAVYLYNYDSSQAWWDEITFSSGNTGTPVSISPTTTGGFVNGVWSGNLTVQQPATNIVLAADDYNGHIGTANPFDAILTNDLSVAATDSPDPAVVGANLTYTLTVSNSGPADSTGVIVTNLLPSTVTFVSATSSQGTCTQAGGVVSCNLGTVPGGTNATISIVVVPTISGTILTNTAFASRAEPELYLDNNTAVVTTQVVPPSVSISDASVVEGNVGTTGMVFAVTLNAPAAQPIVLSYATANGTAFAGSDYIATNGTVTLAPGSTTTNITVNVLGDIQVESNETFFVNLSTLSNVVLARSQAIGTIINDDGLPGQVYSFQWNPIPSPQTQNQPFAATITARDFSSNLVTTFNGTVSVTAVAASPGTNTVGTGTLQSSYPMWTVYPIERTQVIYPASSLTGPGQIRGLALDVAAVPSPMSNWTIRMKHTSLTNYSSFTWDGSGWTIVYQGNVSITSTGWTTFTFPTAFNYDGTDSLMIDFSFSNPGSGLYAYCRGTSQNLARTIYYYTSVGTYGDPLTWTGSSPSPYASTTTPNLRLFCDTGGPTQVIPTSAGPFTNGVWSGNITFPQGATNATLTATDIQGHAGSSNPFQVALSNQPPVALAGPTNTTAYLGGTATFHADFLATPPVSYQWHFNGADILGATNNTLVLNHVLLKQVGVYSVTANNIYGSASSGKAALSIIQVVAWGAGTNNIVSYPYNYRQSIVPGGLTNITRVSGGLYHSLVSSADGRVYAWGAGMTNYISPDYGQSLVPPLGNVVAVAAGGYHSLALRSDGTLAAWGAGTNNINQTPLTGQSIIPPAASNVVAIAAGDYNSIALRNDGKIIAWGYNGYGVTNVPPTATNVVAIAARGNHVVAMRSDGFLVHWGSATVLPVQSSNYVAIAAGVNHMLALRDDGTVVNAGGSYAVPFGLSNVVGIAAGYDYNLALKSDGTVVPWGTVYGTTVPPGLSNVVGVACGAYHALAYLGDGSPVIKYQPSNRAALQFSTTYFSVLAVGQQLRYQWQYNGTNIPNATNFLYRILGVQAFHAGNYRCVLTNAYGAVTSSVVNLTVLTQIGPSVDAPNLTWSTSGNAAWFGETSITHDGIDAAQSGLITDNQQSSLQTTVAGPGVLNFWWKVSSEAYFDYLTFSIDGVQQTNISGEIDWNQQTIPVGSGNHTLQWTYQKDPSVSVGTDAGWLDQVVYTTNPPVINVQPVGQTNYMGGTVGLNVSASGAPPLVYQWVKAGTNLLGANYSFLNIGPATRHDSAIYSVVVSNPGGSTVSSNAYVLIRVPQSLKISPQPDGTFILTSGDVDGGVLLPDDIGNLDPQVSSNLFDWVSLSNSITLTNGMILITDPDWTNYPSRYYRVIEH